MLELKNRIKNLFRSRKINSFLLFFFMAFGILVLTKLSKDYTNTIVLNIEPKQLPDEVVLLNESSNKLKLTLTTYGFKWVKYYLKPPKISVDFIEDVTKTNEAYIWTPTKGFSSISNQFNEDVRIESIKPDTLLFDYDVNAIKYLPVKLNASVNYSNGYDALFGKKTLPDSIKVIGPKSILDKMNAIETKLLELNDVNKPIKEQVSLQLDSIDKMVLIKTRSVEVTANVEKFTEGNIQVPIKVVNLPKRLKINYFPKTIKVSYYTSLDLYKSVNTSDFIVICDYNKIDKDNRFLIPELTKKPTGIKTARIHQQNIEFIISK